MVVAILLVAGILGAHRDAVAQGPGGIGGVVNLVELPNAVGRSESAAREILANFRPVLAGNEISNQAPGTVTRTDPPPGTRVMRQSEVRYWLAVRLVTVPDFGGLPENVAVGRLQALSLRPQRAGEEPSTNPPGTITRTEPGPGEQVAPDSVISYWIAAREVNIPNVIGLDAGDAARRLRDIGLVPNPAGEETSGNAPRTVTRTDPPAGKRVALQTAVSFWIAAPFVTVPNVVGLPDGVAVQRLKAIPLSPRLAGAVESAQAKGTVTRLDPTAGTKVDPDSIVSYWVAAPAPEVVPDVTERPDEEDVRPPRVVPPVAGMSPDVAEDTLRKYGLRPSLGGRESSDFSPGSVTRTDPPVDSPVSPGSEVKYWIADGSIVVPDIVGWRKRDAYYELENDRLTPEFSGDEWSWRFAGTVTRTDPAAGSQVSRGSAVRFWTSREKVWLLILGIGVIAIAVVCSYLYRKWKFEKLARQLEASASFGLAPESETRFGNEGRREKSDLRLAVRIEPGVTRFDSPIRIEKMEVRDE